MALNFSKTLMVLLLCLTFVGQTMASTVMPYQMMSMQGMNNQTAQMTHDMSMMDHSAHNMSVDVMLNNDSDTNSDNCCLTICKCFTGGCSSLATLTKDFTPATLGYFSPKIHSISNLAFSQRLTSLFRPPIFS